MIPGSISRYSYPDHEVLVFGDKDKPKSSLGGDFGVF